ncbi:response regulator [Massilia sp. B-10]|nr:response regulator [Massilia sp. B-10]
MSIQPLLENIFKHTVEQRRQLTRITVAIAREDGCLVVALEDDTGTLAPSTRGKHRPVQFARTALRVVWRRRLAHPEPAHPPLKRAGGNEGAMRILIVDDERPARDKLRRLLEQEPDVAALEEARDGIEALERIAIFKPDVVFLDIQMPEVSGIELAASLPAQRR